MQALLTGAKLLGIAVIVAGAFFFSPGASWSHLAAAGGRQQLGVVQAFGAAMMAALWAYHGWYVLPICAGEVRRPQRNVPRGLLLGLLAVMATYLLANLAYFYALPLTEVVTANSTAHPDALPVAAKAAQTFFGPAGTAFISLAFVISTRGALNGAVMGQARIEPRAAVCSPGQIWGREVSGDYRVVLITNRDETRVNGGNIGGALWSLSPCYCPNLLRYSSEEINALTISA